jgi:hypothetical protein
VGDRVNAFDVLKALGQANCNVGLSSIADNLVSARYYAKRGTQITIGWQGNVVSQLVNGRMVGGLVLADKDEFAQMEARLQAQADRWNGPVGGAWILRFEDVDVDDEIFLGEGAEATARARFEQARQAWSCSLFREVARG